MASLAIFSLLSSSVSGSVIVLLSVQLAVLAFADKVLDVEGLVLVALLYLAEVVHLHFLDAVVVGDVEFPKLEAVKGTEDHLLEGAVPLAEGLELNLPFT